MSEQAASTSTEPRHFQLEAKVLQRAVDGIFAIGTLSLLPLLWLHCQDLWLRTDLKFYPLLIVVPFVFFAWKKSFAPPHKNPRRTYWAIGLLLVAALLAIVAGSQILPWLAWFAFTLAAIGWMIERLGGNPWYQPVAWTAPWWVFLLLPISDRADVATIFLPWVSSSASHALDLFSVPQLSTGNALDLRSGLLPLGPLFNGIGEPYLLISLFVVISMLTKRSALINLLSIISLPAWIWMGAVCHVVVGVLLLENFEWNLFGGSQQIVAKLVVMLLQLLAIWMLQVALKNLFSPFMTYSEGVDGFHRFFNRVVMWPAKDPLRMRKSSDSNAESTSELMARTSIGILVVTIVGFLIAGGIGIKRLLDTGSLSMIAQQEQQATSLKNSLQASDLSPRIQQMVQRSFDPEPLTSSNNTRATAAKWTYDWNGLQVELIATWPLRGFYPVESEVAVTSGGKTTERESFESSESNGPNNVLFDDLTMTDPLFGESYLGYATLGFDQRPIVRTDLPVTWSETIPNWLKKLRVQPSVLSLQLQVIGTGELTEEQRSELRRVLEKAAEELGSKM